MSKEINNNEKIIRSLVDHMVPNGYIDINKLIYEMHGVLSDEPSEKIDDNDKNL